MNETLGTPSCRENAASCNTVVLVYVKCLTRSPPIFWRTGLNEISLCPKFVPVKNITKSTGYHVYHEGQLSHNLCMQRLELYIYCSYAN